MLSSLKRRLSPLSTARAPRRTDAGWADATDLALMIDRGLLVALDGTVGGTPIGRWTGDGPHRGKLLGTPFGLSTLNLAPPGTGKTAAFVIPAITAACESSSLVVHDPKPELFEACAAHLAPRTNLFVLDWFARDHVPERQLTDGLGRPLFDADGLPATEPDHDAATLHPRFNPLSPRIVPVPDARRDSYLDFVALHLVTRRRGVRDDLVTHARDALAVLLRIFLDLASDPDGREGLPAARRGVEPSFPAFVDWFALLRAPSGGEEADSTLVRLLTRIRHDEPVTVRRSETDAFPTIPRTVSALLALPPDERTEAFDVLSASLRVFEDPAVRERTASCDVFPEHLRGMVDPRDGVMKPLALFISQNQAQVSASAGLTSLTLAVLARYAFSFKSGMVIEPTKTTMGPFPVTFVLDEFAKIEEMQHFATWCDLGRSYSTSVMIVAQDYDQLERTYGREHVRAINSVTAVKVVLPQSDDTMVSQVVRLVGQVPLGTDGPPAREGLGRLIPFRPRPSPVDVPRVDFLRRRDVTDMPAGRHMVLVQSFLHRPLSLETVPFYEDPSLLPKVRSRGRGPVGDQVMPSWCHAARVAELRGRRGSRNP